MGANSAPTCVPHYACVRKHRFLGLRIFRRKTGLQDCPRRAWATLFVKSVLIAAAS